MNVAKSSEERNVARRPIRPRSIEYYEPPMEEALAANKVAWEADGRQAAVLIHDLQNYWIEPFERPEPLIDRISWLRSVAHQTGMPVVFTGARPSLSDVDRGFATEMFGPGIGRNPGALASDTQIIDALAPRTGDHIIAKLRYSAFFRTHLDQLLRSRGITQLLICGVYAHHGCMISAIDAYMHDYQVFFVTDALGDDDYESHLSATDYVAQVCGMITSTDILAGQLQPLARYRALHRRSTD